MTTPPLPTPDPQQRVADIEQRLAHNRSVFPDFARVKLWGDPDITFLLAELRRVRAAERERCAKVAWSHLERLPNYNPNNENELADKVEQGYGNAALNIAAAIRAIPDTDEVNNDA